MPKNSQEKILDNSDYKTLNENISYKIIERENEIKCNGEKIKLKENQ